MDLYLLFVLCAAPVSLDFGVERRVIAHYSTEIQTERPPASPCAQRKNVLPPYTYPSYHIIGITSLPLSRLC